MGPFPRLYPHQWNGDSGSIAFGCAGRGSDPDTLPRAFALNAGILPLGLALLGSLHLWRVPKDGRLATLDQEPPAAPFSPWLCRTELAVVLVTLASLLLPATFWEVPLVARADPFHPPNPARAPWYFVGIQEMASHSAEIGGVVAPILLTIFCVLVPTLDRSHSPGRDWSARDRRAFNWRFLSVLMIQLGFIIVGQWFRRENWVFCIPF